MFSRQTLPIRHIRHRPVSYTHLWYNRRTEQALLDVPIPSSTGYTTLKRNIGILENRGFAFGVNMKVLDTNDWLLSLRGNIAYNRNKVIDCLLYTSRCV